MRSRLVIPVAIVIAATAAIFAITRLTAAPASQSPRLGSSLPASPASYLGVYEKGAPASYQPVATFSQAVSRQPNLVGYYSGWGEPFKTSFAAAC